MSAHLDAQMFELNGFFWLECLLTHAFTHACAVDAGEQGRTRAFPSHGRGRRFNPYSAHQKSRDLQGLDGCPLPFPPPLDREQNAISPARLGENQGTLFATRSGVHAHTRVKRITITPKEKPDTVVRRCRADSHLSKGANNGREQYS